MKTIKYILVIIVLAAVISLTTTDAMARGHGHNSGGHGHTSFSIGVGFGGPYYGSYWYGSRYHGRYNMDFYYGYPYYPYDYPVVVERPVIVERPIVIAQPAPVQVYSPPVERLVDGRVKGEVSSSQTTAANSQSNVVWITNDNGSRTPVTLQSQGAGFVGPSNEYYSTLPTEDQLRAQYGLKSNVQPADTAAPAVKSVGVVVFIDNGDGSKTPINLQKEGSNYIGPAGEKYTSLPTEEQLKVLYGSTPSASQTDFNIEITKADGTKILVALKKEGTEFVGPKGERYPSMPTEEQLKLIYGK